jgi:hypothetical protein
VKYSTGYILRQWIMYEDSGMRLMHVGAYVRALEMVILQGIPTLVFEYRFYGKHILIHEVTTTHT